MDQDTTPSIDEVFGLVANDTRFDIIRALWEAEDTPLTFSTLRERTGVRDSGQFNYHLDQLIPRFVRDTGEGYELTYAGQQVIGAAVSGSYTEADTTVVDPIPVGTCPSADCDGTITARYEAGYMTIECQDCATVITDGLAAPPVLAAHHDSAALPLVFNRYLLTWSQALVRGFCRVCSGPIELMPTRFHDDHDALNEAHIDVLSECQACGWTSHSTLFVVLFDHPAVISFLHDLGIDLRETPFWEFDWITDVTERITSKDPIRIEVTLAVGGERLEIILDGDLAVREHNRQ